VYLRLSCPNDEGISTSKKNKKKGDSISKEIFQPKEP
jgi:hypothetical protein